MKVEEFKSKYPELYKLSNECRIQGLDVFDVFVKMYEVGVGDKMFAKESTQAILDEHNALVNSPTALASNLAGLGFKGTLTREDVLYNTLVTDHDTVGTYTETIKIG